MDQETSKKLDRIETLVEDLAAVTAKNFALVTEKFGELDQKIDTFDKKIDTVNENLVGKINGVQRADAQQCIGGKLSLRHD